MSRRGGPLFGAGSKEGFEGGAETAGPRFPVPIHSCHYCSVQELDPGLKSTEDSEIVIRYRAIRLLDGEASGCAFFKDALGSLESTLITEADYLADEPFQPENWVYQLTFYESPSMQLEVAFGHWICSVRGCATALYPEDPEQKFDQYLVVAYQDDPAAGVVPIRPFLSDFRDDGSTLWAMRRLWDCEANHSSCRLPRSLFHPKRLLRIDAPSDGSGMCVRLHQINPSEFDVATEKYASLSYCWGGPQEVQLNTDSENMLRGGLAVSLLPQTIHDAVKVTLSLGIRWIWIDSLCIRQDSEEDKATEVAQMHLIFANSFITLSASRASRCNQGFLYPCTLPAPATIGYKLPFASPSGRLGSVILSKGGSESPIDNRGWALQEHLLSRRVLRYTDYRLHWSCATASIYEEKNTRVLPSDHVTSLDKAYDMYKCIRTSNRSCTNWMAIVMEYSKRCLTDASDALPAISGIAEAWARPSDDEYLAGLWRSHLPVALLWRRLVKWDAESGAYCVPSWSWASSVGPVVWNDCSFTEGDPALKIVSARTNPTHPQAPYGAVHSGFLILHGLVQETAFEPSLARFLGQDARSLANKEDGFLCLDISEASIDGFPSIPAPEIEGARIFSLQIYRFDESTGRGPFGLILATKDGEEFYRIGVFAFGPPKKYEMEKCEDFGALLELSEARKAVQRSAFQGIVPRRIKII